MALVLLEVVNVSRSTFETRTASRLIQNPRLPVFQASLGAFSVSPIESDLFTMLVVGRVKRMKFQLDTTSQSTAVAHHLE
jgi:hypothetical protein